MRVYIPLGFRSEVPVLIIALDADGSIKSEQEGITGHSGDIQKNGAKYLSVTIKKDDEPPETRYFRPEPDDTWTALRHDTALGLVPSEGSPRYRIETLR